MSGVRPVELCEKCAPRPPDVPLCTRCHVAFRIEVVQGFARMMQYLDAWRGLPPPDQE